MSIFTSLVGVFGSLLVKAWRAATYTEPDIGTLKRWSDPANWPGGKPVAGQSLTLPGNWLLDEQTPSLGNVMFTGYVRDDPAVANVGITASRLIISPTGFLRIGSLTSRRSLKATITITGAEELRATRIVADRTGTSGNGAFSSMVGNGKLKRLVASSGAIAETITVLFSGPNDFTVTGSTSGALGSGKVGELFNNRVRFIATAGSIAWAAGDKHTIRMKAQGFTNNGMGRSIQVEVGGRLKLYGRLKTGRTQVMETIPDGAVSCKVLDATGWEVGDEVVLSPTDFADTPSGVAAKRTLTGISGNLATGFTLTWSTPVSGLRWGVLQYPTDTGMSLTPGTLTKPANWTQQEWDDTPKVLDQRCVVINLTRDIVLEGANDSAWTNNGFGLHTMFMGLQSGIEVDSVELRRVGQAGALARYPIHWHVLSYNMPDSLILPSDGTLIGLASGQFVRNCSIHQSSQRMGTIHGTCGVEFSNNVGYDITGHGIFFEEASEMYNKVVGNTIIQVKQPTVANRLTESEAAQGLGDSVAGIWLTNPLNTCTDNWVFGAGIGIWNAFSTRAFGLTQEANVNPNGSRVFEHARNLGACCRTRGLFTEQPPTDNLGSSNDPVYFSGFSENGSRFDFRANKHWKNLGPGYGNRVLAPGSYTGWTAADNLTLDFSGQAGHDVVMRSLLSVGVSLNNGNNAEARAVANRRACFVSYDEGLVVQGILAYNYTLREPPEWTRLGFNGQSASVQGGGLVRMGEYIFPVWTFTEYGKWKLINCNPGYMGTPPNIDGHSVGKGTRFTLGICRDVNGLFTGSPGKHIVWNVPFYTYGAANLQDYTHPAAKITDTVHMGLAATLVSGISETGIRDASQYKYLGAFYVDRLDSTGTNVVGSYNCASSAEEGAEGLDHFKHCAVARGGVYRVGFNGALPGPSVNNSTRKFVSFKLSMMQSPDDIFTLAVAWPGDTPVGTLYQRYQTEDENASFINFVTMSGTPARPQAIKLNNTGMSSKADVIADTTGLKYWQDTANNLVWIKVKGDLVYDDKRKLSNNKVDPNRMICLSIRSNVL